MRSKIHNKNFHYFLVLIILLIVEAPAINSFTQVLESDRYERILRQSGARPLDKSRRRFELNRALIFLSYSEGMLSSVRIEFKKQHLRSEYDVMLQLISKMKSLGSTISSNEIGEVGPSGHVTKTINFSNAFIVRSEKLFSKGKVSEFRIDRFTVFYWFPITGKIENKRIESIKIENLIDEKRYYATINGEELRVEPSLYTHLLIGQFVSLERNVGNNFVRTPSPQ